MYYVILLKGCAMLQEKGAGAPAGKDALKPGQVPKGRGFFTSAWSSAGPDKKDSPEQKKGVRTDPDMAPPKPETGKHDTPSSQKTNELVCMLCDVQLPMVLYSLHYSMRKPSSCIIPARLANFGSISAIARSSCICSNTMACHSLVSCMCLLPAIL